MIVVTACVDTLAFTPPGRTGNASATCDATNQHARLQRVCLASLDEIRLEFDRYREKHSELVGHLGSGTINASELSLHFPVVEPAKRIRSAAGRRMARSPRLRPGLFLQFTLPTAYPTKPDELPEQASYGFGQPMYWFHLRARLCWTWHWAGGFTPEAMAAFQEIVKEAVRPIADMEAAAWKRDLSGRGPGSYVLYGGRGLEPVIRLDARQSNEHTGALELHAVNAAAETTAIHPSGEWIVIVDGEARADDLFPRCQAYFLSQRLCVNDPFVYLKSGETRKLRTVPLGDLAPGRHTVRIAWQQTQAGWTDFGPIRSDGAPVYREVESAWTGVVVSNKLTIDF